MSDINAGILAALGIVAAYAHRLQTGRGQIVYTSLMEAALQQTFDDAGVPAGPVRSLAEALTHPQTPARGMVVDLVHPEAGATKAIGCPIHFSRTPTRIDRPAPLLGEHTRGLLHDHGYTDAEIAAFIADGMVATTAESAGQ